MVKNKVLIVSSKFDTHINKVKEYIEAKGYRCFLLFLDEFPINYNLTFSVSSGVATATITYKSSGETLTLDEVGAIWLRKPGQYEYQDADLPEDVKQFADQESEHALFSVLYSLDCYWISHPMHLRAAQWKGEQLKRAANLGFIVSDTVISNDAKAVKTFSQHQAKLVYKTMSDPVIGNDADTEVPVPTTLVTQDMLEEEAPLNLMPNQFQAYVEKAYELRVTVVDGEVYAAKIDSQLHEESQVDSRCLEVDVPYSHYTLPKAVAQKCIQLVESYRLSYSAIDLIVTPKGEYVFLENNPNGQFAYVEDKVPSLLLSQAVASALVKRCSV